MCTDKLEIQSHFASANNPHARRPVIRQSEQTLLEQSADSYDGHLSRTSRAALISPLDVGVNSVIAYCRGHTVKVMAEDVCVCVCVCVCVMELLHT